MSLIEKKYNIAELEDYIANNVSNGFDWFNISRYQKLTEDFIEKHSDKVNWDNIAFSQMLSYDFLEKHLYKYSLYMKYMDKCVNIEHLIKLQKKFHDKYNIDKLTYELVIDEL